MELLTPSFGLVFWMCLGFGILFFLLSKFAWKPILSALHEREQSIESSLREAEKARAEMAGLVARNEELLNQAKEERSAILAEAKEAAEKLRTDIVEKARQEAEGKVADAIREIDIQKRAALVEVKNKVGLMALEIAGQVMRKELSSDAAHKQYVEKLAQESGL